MSEFDFRTVKQLISSGDLDAIKTYFGEDKELLNEENNYFGTAIHIASKNGDASVIGCLIELGADPNNKSKYSEKTPLTFAIGSGSLDSVKVLFANGASFDLKTSFNNLYLHAIVNGHLELVEYFLGIGIDANVVAIREDGSKCNALSFAIEREETEIVELLKQHGCTLPPDFESDDLYDTSEKEGALVQHIEGCFGTANALSLQSVFPTPGNINIHYIRSSSEHPFSTVFTNGMSEARMEPEDGAEGFEYAELVWHLPESWPDLIKSKNNEAALWPLQVMRMVGSYPHVMDTWLGPIPTLSLTDPPQPLGPNTKLSSLLLIPDEVEPLETSEKTINFYTVYPIYDEELEMVHENGIDALLDRLKANNVSSVLDSDRVNTCA